MGYHISIVRTSAEDEGATSSVQQTEVISAASKLGFSIKYNGENDVELISKVIGEEEVTLFFDDSELWSKNPSDLALESMLELATTIGNKARVRGDEGETYKDKGTTYTHPHDAPTNSRATSREIDWPSTISSAIPIIVGLWFLYVSSKLIIKLLMKKYGI